jgi:ATP-binding cassette subfamily F protein 3
VEDGHVETYPGTLDEYMDSCRRRQQASEAAGRKGDKVDKVGAAAKLERSAAPAAEPRSDRDADKERKRREAAQRQARAGEKKLASEVEKLEHQIATLETAQAQRSTELANPEVYADKARSQKLIDAFRDAQKELELLQSRWEHALTQLEAARAAQ